MRISLTLLSASVASIQLLPSVVTAQSRDSATTIGVPQQTRSLFRRGLAAYNSGQVDTARQLFLQAWAIRPSADVAMELAQTEMDLGKYVDAAEHLDYALRNFTPSINEKMRNIAKLAHSEVVRHVARITVDVNIEGAEVLLNGRVVGKSPVQETLYADAGNCVIQARLGATNVSKSLVAEPGKELRVTLTLEQPAKLASDSGLVPGSPGEYRPTAFSDTLDTHRNPVPLIIGGAVTVLAFSAGLGLRIASNSAEDDASTLSATLGSQGCSTPNANAALCASLRHSIEKSDRERNWSTASFVIASAALVGTAAYWFWPRKKHHVAQNGVAISGSAGTNAGALVLTGSW
jgi:hypothetical protein